jgi:hypothetical protein
MLARPHRRSRERLRRPAHRGLSLIYLTMPLVTSHTQSSLPDRGTVFVSHAQTAFKELYLVSGAAAQLGAHGIQVQEAQWQALARAARQASAVLGARDDGESEAMSAFRRLARMCDDLLDRRAMGHACPSSLWHDVARAGRDTYDQLSA